MLSGSQLDDSLRWPVRLFQVPQGFRQTRNSGGQTTDHPGMGNAIAVPRRSKKYLKSFNY